MSEIELKRLNTTNFIAGLNEKSFTARLVVELGLEQRFLNSIVILLFSHSLSVAW